MAEYRDDVVQALHKMVARGLPHWGLAASSEISLLNLSENATFLLTDHPSGRRYVLRVHRIGYSSAEEIRSELAWIAALERDRVVETARAFPGRDGAALQTLESEGGGQSRFAVIFEYLPGREPDPGADGVVWFERLGELTAKMHNHARSWPLPAGFRRKIWDLPAMVGDQAYWGPWRAASGLDRSGIAVIERALVQIEDRLTRYGKAADRFGLVHADLRLANLLVDGLHLRIIDFDDCGFSWFLYDFATAISFIEEDPEVPALRHAWGVGYRKVAALSAEDWALMPHLVVLRRILLTAWLASHAEVPLAQKIGARFGAGTVAIAEELLQGRFLA